ncbi:phosphomevalonate kinase [Kitasatospora sp. NPDC002040]|uniref:phosphomevalonate kinase n=1 Tax=Kitasatospora sp. NPDC002040 TaxID=3154661 RepID=UPI00331922F1
MRPPVTHRAPGKLLIAGEYAVLEPGQPSIVVAVDRFVTVTASTPLDGEVVLDTDLLPHEVRMSRSPTGLRPLDPVHAPHVDGALTHLMSVMEVLDQLTRQLALPPVPVRLSVRSGLHEHGTKIGLGSSGAVTVAAVSALARFYGLPLSPHEQFRLALLASIRVDPGPSGVDLAASTWGGWTIYRAPDRDRLLRSLRRDGVTTTLHATWPGLTVRALPAPTALRLYAGWSGSPASTSARVRGLSRTTWWHSTDHDRFLHQSARTVTSAACALEHDDPAALLAAVHRARHLLALLDERTGLGIFTPRLSALCHAAQACGGAGKPSGAGGGDCGIALLPHTTDPHSLRTRWAADGITALPLRVTDLPGTEGPGADVAGPDLTPGPLLSPSAPTHRGEPR